MIGDLRSAVDQARATGRDATAGNWLVQPDARTATARVTRWLDPPGTVSRTGLTMVCNAIGDWPVWAVDEIVASLTPPSS